MPGQKTYLIKWRGTQTGESTCQASSPEEALSKAKNGYDVGFEALDIKWEAMEAVLPGSYRPIPAMPAVASPPSTAIRNTHGWCIDDGPETIHLGNNGLHFIIREGCDCELCEETGRVFSTFLNNCYCSACRAYLRHVDEVRMSRRGHVAINEEPF